MNIQALLGARPATGSSRRPAVEVKGKERASAQPSAEEPRDTVELSVEGRERAASDGGGE